MVRVSFIFGTRPEAIKLAPLILRCKADPEVETCVYLTGQHVELLDPVLQFFDIQPDKVLKVDHHKGELTDLVANIIIQAKNLLEIDKPDVLIVHGDTASTFSGAVAGFYCKVPVVHVEAGLRTGDLQNPWPEEMHRRAVTQFADFHFAPTSLNASNLVSEGIPKEKIKIVGNTVVDALIQAKEIVSAQVFQNELKVKFQYLDRFADVILITGHRRENFGPAFESICNAIKQSAKNNRTIAFVYPVHLNPHVRGPVHRILSETENVFLIEPLAYPDFVYLMNRSIFIITDSGGIQEEAPALGKRVILMRNKTERAEAVELGFVRIAGTQEETIVAAIDEYLSLHQRRISNQTVDIYGVGDTSEKILRIIKKIYSKSYY